MVCGIIELEGMTGESGSTSRSDAIFKIYIKYLASLSRDEAEVSRRDWERA